MRRCAVRCSRSAKRSCSNITRGRERLAARFIRIACPRDCRTALQPVAKALGALRELHAARNHRPVADTIGRLIAVTRAHAGFILWRGGEQVLANVLHISDLARRYEPKAGCRSAASSTCCTTPRPIAPGAGSADSRRGQRRRAPDDGAQGEGPRVPGRRARRHRLQAEPRRCVALSRSGEAALRGADRRMVAARSAGAQRPKRRSATKPKAFAWPTSPPRARATCWSCRRSATVRTTKGWVRPLNRALYPPGDERQSPRARGRLPLFKGKDTVLERPDGEQPGASTRASRRVRPDRSRHRGERVHRRLVGSAAARRPGDDARGLRRDDLIAKDARPEDVAADRARYDAWRRAAARAVLEQGDACRP